MSRGRRWGLLAGVTLVALAGGALLRVSLWRPLSLVGESPRDGFARVAGVVHVHTTLSDGGGTPDEVIAAAHRTGLRFVAITDHNNLDAKPLEEERDGLLVLVGGEISTPSGHVLGLGLERDPVYRFNGDGLDALEDVRDLGGFAFAAHPFSSRPDLRWTGWDLPGPWGIELVNGDSEWRRAGPRLLLSAALYRLNPAWALLQTLSPPDEALRRWDALLAKRDVVGLAGADAHSRLPLTKTWNLRFPAYEELFGLTRLHLVLDQPLSGEAVADRRAVLEALRRGRFWLGLDALAAADGFSFTVECADGRRRTVGDDVPLGAGAVVKAGGRVPAGTRLVLLRDGQPLAEAVERLSVPLAGPGVYRVEARVPGWPVPWVITNPVFAFDAATRESRRRAAEWPEPARPRDVTPLAALPGSAAFAGEFDPTSSIEEPVVVPGSGPGGDAGLRLAFRLGRPTAAQPFTWCALVNRQSRDLSGFRGLRFRVRADGEYRIWIQLRDVNPASADEGLEWWLASARTSAEWREVVLPFTRWRTINRKSDGRLDLDRVQALVFVLDGAAVKVGTRGTIDFADVGFYR